MKEITAANAEAYLIEQGWLGQGPFTVTELSGGVSNWVGRVETPAGERFILKQARPQLRTQVEWFSDITRIEREQAIMRLLHPLLPEGCVPRVLFSDRANYAFVMTHAPMPSRDWRTVLLAGEIDPRLGSEAGRILALIHRVTWHHAERLAPFHDATIFHQLRTEPFYASIRRQSPELSAGIDPLMERLKHCRDALCHGDFSPKNLLLHDGTFTLVDYETAYAGDAAMDVGFFLSHLLLKAVRRPNQFAAWSALTQAFWQAYDGGADVRASLAHCGLCVLARIDGTSPVPYLPEPDRREAARRLGRSLLREPPSDWSGVLALLHRELHPWLLERPAAEGGT